MKYVGIWYNLEKEVKRDIVEANTDEEARKKLYLKYEGIETPAELLSVVAQN